MSSSIIKYLHIIIILIQFLRLFCRKYAIIQCTMSASLGGLLKDYRLQRNIAQMEVAFALGWKDTSRLSRIEQGVVEKPPRELIDKISKALNLKAQEKNTLLLIGNYLPTKEELEQTRKENEAYLETWPYPAILYDFCWRIILLNKSALRMLSMNKKDKKKAYEVAPSALELVFDPKYVQNQYLKGDEVKVWHTNLFRFLTHFKNFQKSIIRDKWYMATMKKMMNNDLFRELWTKVQNSEVNFITTRFGKKIFVSPEDRNKRLKFNIFVVPLMKDPRFELEFFNPADTETADFFTKSK